MAFLLYFMTFVLAFLIQTSPLVFSAGSSWRVDLTLLLVVYGGLFWGEQRALVIGFLTGLGQDALSTEMLGLHALSKSLSVYVVLLLRHNVQIHTLIAQEVFVLLVISTDALVRVLTSVVFQVPLWSLEVICSALVRQALLSVLLMPFVYRGLSALERCVDAYTHKAGKANLSSSQRVR